MTDDWMQERTQAPLDQMKHWVKNCACELGMPVVEAVSDRIGIAKAGKRMLDEGGEEAELEILAKKIALDAVALDEEITDKIHDAAILYNEAASLLQTQTSGLGRLGHLVEAYSKRSSMYNQMSQGLDEAPEEPTLSDVEWDAFKFVQLRQFKAQLGLRDNVGGKKAGRHGYSFFNCIERDDRTYRVPAQPQITAAAGAPGCSKEMPVPTSESITPSIANWSVSAGGNHTGNLTNCGKRPGGGSMASLVEAAEEQEQDFEPRIALQNSESPKRGDTLDTLETCLDSLDNMKNVIVTMNTQPSAVDYAQGSFAVTSSLVPSGSFLAPGRSISSSAHPQGSFAVADVAHKPRRDVSNVSSQGSCSTHIYSGPAGALGQALNIKASKAPCLSPDASFASYAVAAPTQSLQMHVPSSTPTPVGVCPYTVNDRVEIKSKSAKSWIAGKVVRVDGWILTVQYGDRERKVDLNCDNLSQFFRSVQHHAVTSPAPAFDSMLTNLGGPVFTDVDSVVSVPARHTKAAVL
jgi:hypothetical protein